MLAEFARSTRRTGEPGCVCIDDCGFEVDPRRKVQLMKNGFIF